MLEQAYFTSPFALCRIKVPLKLDIPVLHVQQIFLKYAVVNQIGSCSFTQVHVYDILDI